MIQSVPIDIDYGGVHVHTYVYVCSRLFLRCRAFAIGEWVSVKGDVGLGDRNAEHGGTRRKPRAVSHPRFSYGGSDGFR